MSFWRPSFRNRLVPGGYASAWPPPLNRKCNVFCRLAMFWAEWALLMWLSTRSSLWSINSKLRLFMCKTMEGLVIPSQSHKRLVSKPHASRFFSAVWHILPYISEILHPGLQISIPTLLSVVYPFGHQHVDELRVLWMRLLSTYADCHFKPFVKIKPWRDLIFRFSQVKRKKKCRKKRK